MMITIQAGIQSKTVIAMKRNMFLLAAIVGIAAVGCNKEITNNFDDKEGFVEMTFTASLSQTKVAIDQQEANALTLKWSDQDVIKVFTETTSAVSNTLSNPSGSNVNFTVSLENSAKAPFYAAYPATAPVMQEGKDCVDNDGNLLVTIPQFQAPTDNTFATNAYVAIAKADANNSYQFKSLVSGVKFSIASDASNIERIIFAAKDENGNYVNLTGKGSINVKSSDFDEPMLTMNGEVFNTAILKGDFKNSVQYYIMFSPNTCKGGIELFFVLKDGTIYKAANTKQLFANDNYRNCIRNLGQLNYTKFPYATNYDQYQFLGRSLKFGDITIDKATYGDATLINKADFSIKTDGVYFIDPGCSVKIEATDFSKLIVASNSNTNRATVSTNNYIFAKQTNGDKDIICFANVDFSSAATNYLFNQRDNDTFETLAFYNFKTDINKAPFFYTNFSKNIGKVYMEKCDIRMSDTAGKSIFQLTPAVTVNEFVLKDNVIWCDESEKNKTNFFILNAANATISQLTFNKNTIAYAYPNGGNAYINAATINSWTSQNNLFYLYDYSTVTKTASYIIKANTIKVNSNVTNKSVAIYNTSLNSSSSLRVLNGVTQDYDYLWIYSKSKDISSFDKTTGNFVRPTGVDNTFGATR